MSHPMMAQATHDELAGQLFTRDLKAFITKELEGAQRTLAEAVRLDRGGDADSHEAVCAIRDRLFDYETFRSWVSLKRTSQEIMWDVVAESVDRQVDRLDAAAKIAEPKGSLRLDPDFDPPSYLTAGDIHLMPGGYAADEGGVRQGALMDRGGAVYMLGAVNGGMINDARGQAVVAHVFDLYPDLEPRRILEMGCGVGVSATAIAGHFPDADIQGVDVGGSMLRYAHARAEHLSAPVHFSQQNAEATDFPQGHFDLVFTAAVFHESSASAIGKIIAEAHRVLRPGGVLINLEVPLRYADMDLWQKISGEYETHFNNEPCWYEAIVVDYAQAFRSVGFADVTTGYQAAGPAVRGRQGFQTTKGQGRGQWFVVSARK